ncbi:MAG: cytochrome c oxidase subunit II [bacterium]|nr:cytochrome c oxidase subunit II [bacterium]
MWDDFSLFPEQASTFAAKVDLLYFALVGLSVFFAGLIFLLVLIFAIRYRRKSDSEQPRAIHGDLRLELAWSLIPLVLSMGVFVWAAQLYFSMSIPPSNAMEIYVVGKQWMWKLQHPEGKSEINELHVPVGQAVRLTMTSEDVIHSFYIPAFRVKQDVLPGRYTSVWFEATKPGEYHLFCAEYCGNEHSRMIGRVVVMEPVEYEAWLSGGVGGESMAVAGERLFQQTGCVTCHRPDSQGRGPVLDGLFGHSVKLKNGQTVLADEAYLRESILTPNAKMVDGYKALMPTYQGQLSEAGILQIIEYIKSLKK